MYAELAFLQLFVNEEIELAQIINADKELNRKEKALLAELEVCLIICLTMVLCRSNNLISLHSLQEYVIDIFCGNWKKKN